MISFFQNFKDKFNKKTEENICEKTNALYQNLKNLYSPNSISDERKEYLTNLINKNGYLPYPHTKVLTDLTDAEVLFGLEIKWKNQGVMNENGEFKFENNKISPAQRAEYTNSQWFSKEQHNIKLINLAGLGNGNKTTQTGKFMDWLRQLLILPTGLDEAKILGTTIYLIPFHPREFGCAYLPASTEVSQKLEDKELSDKLEIDVKQQVQLFVQLAQLAGHCVIYDVLPQTGRFSKIVLANPSVARWYDIAELISNLEKAADKAAEKLKEESDYEAEDIDIVKDIYKDTLKSGSNSLSEHYQGIYNKLENIIFPIKKNLSNEMLKKESQKKLHEKIKKIIYDFNEISLEQKANEEDIKQQKETIKLLIKENLWPAPGGAWCSAGVPIFDRMSETGDYPVFKHFDLDGKDVTHFANLDCQTPYYFVYLESGEYNEPVIDVYIEYLEKLQKDYNFDGFRVDHIDHIVDRVSEKDGTPISYRAPRKVLGKANDIMKQKVPHFATLAEYMLWDKFYQEYHQDMNFDVLWGNDIISQFCKNPQEIIYNNQDLENYNNNLNNKTPLSILKTYNNQDGEFSAIDQYPGQLGEQGALFKWLKYKFLPGGKNAQRPVMFIDGDESFTKTGIESVIGAEVSMKRENNLKFFNQFNAINKFALENILTREGEAQIIRQDDDGFVGWMVSKDPLKESLLVVANYNSPTEKVTENRDGIDHIYMKDGHPIYDKTIEMPCDYSIVSEYIYKDGEVGEATFEETKLEQPQTNIHFDELKPSEFHIYRIKK